MERPTTQGTNIEKKGEKRMRKQILAILIAIGMGCAFAPLVGANDHIDIVITPSGGTATIDVNQTTWTGGAATVGGAEVKTGATYDWANLTNTGNVPVDVKVSVAHSADWQDGAAAGHNVFMLNYYLSASPVMINTSGVVFKDNLPYAGYQNFDLGIQLPSSTSVVTEQTITVTFTATMA
jgi:hypothetical protein